ncbi:MarR family transcriptional regulator [Bacillus sp. NPDC077027]|uniref:MarR family transcriptional regulator n=1 Tax=Bacillus sp. NPDC077027 TaxID=3390548 RepID=UPI003CFD2E56
METKEQHVLKAIQDLILQREKRRNDPTDPLITTEDTLKQEWTLTQLHILSIIQAHPEESNNTFLSQQLRLSKPAITKAVKKLIESDVIDYSHRNGDKKSVYYSLTEQGKELAVLHDHLHARAVESYLDLLHQFSANELDVIERFLRAWKEKL